MINLKDQPLIDEAYQTQRKMNENTFRQWIMGRLLEGKEVNITNGQIVKDIAIDIIEFGKKQGIIQFTVNPDVPPPPPPNKPKDK